MVGKSYEEMQEEKRKREQAERDRKYKEEERQRERERARELYEREKKIEIERYKNIGRVGRSASGMSGLIFPIGVIVLGYYVLKSWGIVGTASLSNNQNIGWQELSIEQWNNIHRIIDGNIYRIGR